MSIEGYVDGVRDGEVFGWAMDTSAPDTCVKLSVYVDEKPFTTVLALQDRRDVANVFNNKGLNGFSVSIPVGLAKHSAVVISIRDEDGRDLPRSPITVTRGALDSRVVSASDTDDLLLFMHIPKTAGTAFREAVSKHYRGSQLLFMYPDPPGIWSEEFRRVPVEQKESVKCVIGHFMFGLHEEFSRPARYVTMIRHPISRVSSHYHHMVRNHSPLVESPEGDIIPLHQLLEMQVAGELDNLMVRFFAGMEGDGFPCGAVSGDSVELAVKNVERFDFIGHQERADGAWEEFCRRSEWELAPLNVSNVGPDHLSHLAECTKAAIEYYCRYDLMLYERILHKYPL